MVDRENVGKFWARNQYIAHNHPTVCQYSVHNSPTSTICQHFHQLFPHKLSINQLFLFNPPTWKSTYYPEIHILSMCSRTKIRNFKVGCCLSTFYQHLPHIALTLSYLWQSQYVSLSSFSYSPPPQLPNIEFKQQNDHGNFSQRWLGHHLMVVLGSDWSTI